MDGSQIERDLVNVCHEIGLAAVRMPDSGSATKRELPDVIVFRPFQRGNLEVWAIELKSTSDDYAYIKAAEAEALKAFAKRSGSRPLAGSRFSGDRRFFLIDIGRAERTNSGNISIKRETAADRASIIINEREKTILTGWST